MQGQIFPLGGSADPKKKEKTLQKGGRLAVPVSGADNYFYIEMGTKFWPLFWAGRLATGSKFGHVAVAIRLPFIMLIEAQKNTATHPGFEGWGCCLDKP